MILALNVFNLSKNKEHLYKEYSIKAGKIIYSKGGKVISSGCNPIRKLKSDVLRNYFIIVEFPSEKVFQNFLDEGEKQNIHSLREDSTSEYIWTLYENWNIKNWVNNS